MNFIIDNTEKIIIIFFNSMSTMDKILVWDYETP